MNMGVKETSDFAVDFRERYEEHESVDVFICPPFTSIPEAVSRFKNSGIEVGAQNVYWEDSGAFTGEISPEFLLEVGVRWVIVGHSERRKYFGETSRDIRKKVKKALQKGLNVVICIGESGEEREAGKEREVVKKQLEGGLLGIDFEPRNVSIAYEPVWAIGTGVTPEPEEAEDMHGEIRRLLGERGEKMRIMYGGSLKPHNAEDFLSQEDIDGGLIGGASLKPESFNKIIKIAGGLSC